MRDLILTDFNTPALDILIADMWTTIHATDGAGLAPNQTGVDMRVFVYDVTDSKKEYEPGSNVTPWLRSWKGRRLGLRAVSDRNNRVRKAGNHLRKPTFLTPALRHTSLVPVDSRPWSRPARQICEDSCNGITSDGPTAQD